MGPGQPQTMAQAVGERQARLDIDIDILSVDLELHPHAATLTFADAAAGALERPLDHGAHQRTPIIGAGVNVGLRIDGSASRSLGLRDRRIVDRAAVQDRLHRGQALRTVANPDGAHMGITRFAAIVPIVPDRGRRHGEIAAPPREFLKTPAPLRRPCGEIGFPR
jgi:hypothetical protein